MSKILVVEDEEHIQRLIKIILERGGQEVQTAGSGEEALALLDSGLRPHLILLDIMLPGMDGLQVLQKVKANKDTQAISVVMLTALAKETVVLQGVKLGARDYIRKPFHPKVLMSRLAPFLKDS